MVENSKGRERPNFAQARIFGCLSVVRVERSLLTSTNNQRGCLKAYGVGKFTEGNKMWESEKMVEVLDHICDPMKPAFCKRFKHFIDINN